MSDPRPTSRTSDEPMAFTKDDFWRGAWSAWTTFIVFMLGSMLLSITVAYPAIVLSPLLVLVIVGTAALYGGGISLAALVVGSPIAWAIGRLLRRQPRMIVHAAAYIGLGMLTGLLALLVLRLIIPGGTVDFSTSLIVLSAVAAPPLGWWRAVRIARRVELGLRVPRRRPDEDAEYEDAL